MVKIHLPAEPNRRAQLKLLGGLLCAAVLEACANTGLPSSTPSAGESQRFHRSVEPSTGGYGYKVLYGFGGGDDGAGPEAGLFVFKGKLYGTTTRGGTYGHGTVFRITTSGNEHVLHSFSGVDGDTPDAPLTNLNGTFYGTTARGGSGTCSCGTVFSASSSGQERVLHSFSEDENGWAPVAGLTISKGILYGTTYFGGTGCGYEGCGTAFSITPHGKYRLLHDFGDEFGDPDFVANPWAGLTLFNGRFYGTSLDGGYSDLGTVFALSTKGKLDILHSFDRGYGGNLPIGNVTVLGGTLYGTTFEGGTGNGCAGTGGCGVVYSLTTDGQAHVVHSFDYSTGDGAFPMASLIEFKGKLYGTTSSGGAKCGSNSGDGCGTVFRLTTDGQETVLHRFIGGSDGAYPDAGLTIFRGTLYGTTAYGGAMNGGVVFALRP